VPPSTQRFGPAAASYDPSAYESLVAVEDRHFWFRARNRAIVAAFESLKHELRPGYRVLEVGCGTGNVLRELQKTAVGGNVIGMDVHPEGLLYAQHRLNSALLICADLARTPFSTRFEIVGLFDVLEHIEDDMAALRNLRSLLTVQGALLITVPADQRLWSYFDTASHHQRRYEARELNEKLVAAGYNVEYLTPYMSVLHPILWAARRLAALGGPDNYDAASAKVAAQADLRVRPASGAVLGFLLGQELRLLRRRRRIPIGASLLAIARVAG
jgi:SAM-dependent methyltransferase